MREISRKEYTKKEEWVSYDYDSIEEKNEHIIEMENKDYACMGAGATSATFRKIEVI